MRKSFVKKSAALCLSAVMVLSLAVGCGSKDGVTGKDSKSGKKSSVSAEELLDGAKLSADSIDAELSFTIAGEIDMSSLSEDEGDDKSSEKSKISITGKYAFEADEDTVHIKGTLEGKADGEEEDLNQSYEVYRQKNKNSVSTYEYDSDEKEWYVSEDDLNEVDEEDVEKLKNTVINKDNFKSLKAEENSKGFVVTGVLDYEKCVKNAQSLDDDVPDYDDLTEQIDDMGFDASKLPDIKVVITFDKEKNPTSIEITTDLDKLNSQIKDYGSVSKLSIKLTINKTSDVKVEVPNSVSSKAVSEDDDDYDFSSLFDDKNDKDDKDDKTTTSTPSITVSSGDETVANNFGYSKDSVEYTKKLYVYWFDGEKVTAKDLIEDAIYIENFAKDEKNAAVMEKAAEYFNKYTTVEFDKYIVENYSKLSDVEKKAAACICAEGYEVSYHIADNLSKADSDEFEKLVDAAEK